MDVAGVGRRAVIGSLAAAAIAPKSAAQTPPPTPDALRYLDAAERLTVKARVNGQGPFDFLVDTGASSSVIAGELADRLGLARMGRGQMHGIAGPQDVDTVVVDSLDVGRRRRQRMALSVLPRSTLVVDGILGLEWLGHASLLLDFKRRRMTVGEALPLPDQNTISVPSKLVKSGLILIDAFIPGQRITAFVDSGSTTTVGNLAFFERARAKGSIVGQTVATELRSVTGQTLQGRFVTVSRLTLGKVVLARVPMVIGPIHTFDYWGMHAEPAVLIGSDILRAFDAVMIDSRAGEVRFKVSDPTGNGAI